MNRRTKRLAILAGSVVVVGGLAVGMSGTAKAATPGCTAVALAGCGSWNAEVPGTPDLDVLGGAPVAGNSLIVYTRTNHDKAEDFAIQNVNISATSKYTVGGFTAGSTVAPPQSVAIRYAPNGIDSGLCVSTVNPNGHAAAQLRACSNNISTFNPFQTFTSAAATGDGTFVKFREVINGYVMTDPANNGSIGTVGHRVHVIFATDHSHTGQLWGQNGI